MDEGVNVTYVDTKGDLPVEEHPILRKGDTGDDVMYLQTLLKDNGATIKIDGKFGTATEQCVKDFQRKNGLKDDGIVGPKTWEALEYEEAETITISKEYLLTMKNHLQLTLDMIDAVLNTVG